MLIIQNDLLDELRVRVVVPLFRFSDYGAGAGSLNPTMDVNGSKYVMMTEYIASITVRDLGEMVGSLANERDTIVRAIDTLLAGV